MTKMMRYSSDDDDDGNGNDVDDGRPTDKPTSVTETIFYVRISALISI